jgi:hypothetical protein
MRLWCLSLQTLIDRYRRHHGARRRGGIRRRAAVRRGPGRTSTGESGGQTATERWSAKGLRTSCSSASGRCCSSASLCLASHPRLRLRTGTGNAFVALRIFARPCSDTVLVRVPKHPCPLACCLSSSSVRSRTFFSSIMPIAAHIAVEMDHPMIQRMSHIYFFLKKLR